MARVEALMRHTRSHSPGGAISAKRSVDFGSIVRVDLLGTEATRDGKPVESFRARISTGSVI